MPMIARPNHLVKRPNQGQARYLSRRRFIRDCYFSNCRQLSDRQTADSIQCCYQWWALLRRGSSLKAARAVMTLARHVTIGSTKSI